MRHTHWIGLVTVPFALCTCGEMPSGQEAATDAESSSAADRPRGSYVVQPRTELSVMDEHAPIAAIARRVLFVNRRGGTYTPGNNDSSRNVSSIARSTTTIAAYAWGDASWNQFLSCIRDEYARFNVEVTDADPGAATHIEAVVGGSPTDLGLATNVGGVAPMYGDCSIVERAIVYIFAGRFSSPQTQCEIAAQEIAHAYGLDHEFLCEDPMTYLGGCGHKTFQDRTVSCGEYQARACMCSGQQNSYRVLLDRLGPAGATPPPPPPTGDVTAPTVSVVSPAQGATPPGNTTLRVIAQASDDVGVTKVELFWHYSNRTLGCDGSGSDGCQRSGNQYTWSLRVGTGPRDFEVRASDAAGHTTTTPTRSISLR